MYEYSRLSKEQKAEIVQYRLQQGYPPHSPPHPVKNHSFYLITAACYKHKPRLNSSQRRQELLNELFTVFIEEGISILAWVVLPNHYHLLTEKLEFKWLSQQLKLIHGRSAYQWNKEDKVQGNMWCSYTDRAIRSERHYYATLNYIHYNAVKHNWVKSPYDWSESSVHWYLQTKGKEWLRNSWVEYPVRDYGKNWDLD